MSDNEQSSITVKVGKHEVVLTENIADALEVLQLDEGWLAKEFVALVDTVSIELAIMGEYKPSEEGKKRFYDMVATMKERIYQLIDEDCYEKYR